MTISMTKKSFLLSVVVLLSAVAAAQSYVPPNEFPLYTTVAPARQAQYMAWVWSHGRMVSGGHNDLSSGMTAGQTWNRYVDAEGFYLPSIYPHLYVTADANGLDPEGAFLHYAKDYSTSGKVLTNGDEFDFWETLCCAGIGDAYYATHGVMNWNGASYTDVTRQAYCPASVPFGSSCTTYRPTPFTIADHLLLGRQIPFYTINVTVNTGRVGGGVTYKYWNGSGYVTLTPTRDTTSGLTTTGTVTFLPPSDWVRNVDQGTYAKYHVLIQLTGSPSTKPVIGRVYGDNALAGGQMRGWNPSACVSGRINIGTPVEYCDVPASGSSAKMRGEARLVTGYNYNQFFGNQIDVQGGVSTWAYAKLAEANYDLSSAGGGYLGMNGVIYDDGGASPSWPGFSFINTEYGNTTAQAASAFWFPKMYSLFKAVHPTFLQGVNTYGSAASFNISMSMDFVHNENTNDTANSNNPQTDIPLNICPNVWWCSKTGVGKKPTVFQLASSMDYSQYAMRDYYGVYHPWNMGSQGPITALAQYYLIQNPNVLFTYNPQGVGSVSGQDDYDYWVESSATLTSTHAAQSACTVGAPCTITTSASLAATAPACPDADGIGVVSQTSQCPLRICGTSGCDVLPSVSVPYGGRGYTGSSFPITSQGFAFAHVPGDTVEYMVRAWQSQASGVYQQPIALWSYHIPASDIYLGVPDSTFGFSAPCRNDNTGLLKDCQWLSGAAVSGAPGSCQATISSKGHNCSPLVRRDFTGGTYGRAIVLLRPSSISSDWHFTTASSEYDTPSIDIPLPGTYYRLNSDGTIDPTPLTKVKLVGREAFIGVSNNGS